MEFKEEIIKLLKKRTKLDEIKLEVPPSENLGDYSFPCFDLAKTLKKDPNKIAKELSEKIRSKNFRTENKGPYLNFFIDKNKLTKEVLNKILREKERYGSENIGKGKIVVIDMSSPNIAKPFGIGHLRSTIIGDVVRNLHVFLGYKVFRINHLGDWGTQFGKLIFAYKKWGNRKKLVKDPIKYLLGLYIKGNKEEYEEEGRRWFKKLEEGDKEALKLWKEFRELSLREFKKIYDLLNVNFESYAGEAFYNDKLNDAIKILQKRGIVTESEGALIVDLTQYGMPPLLLKKSDGATLYATRDIAAALYRKEKYKFSVAVYEVGSEQKLYFKQLFKTLEIAGFEWANKMVHVDHGLYLGEDGKKLSTRKGKVIFMEDILNEGVNKTKKIIQAKNPKLKNKDDISIKVAVSAIKYGDLKNDRTKDVIFNWDKFLDFNGETGPYIQYAHVRACSVLRKCKLVKDVDLSLLKEKSEIELVRHLKDFNDIVKSAAFEYKPHILAKYVYELAQKFNDFYEKVQILKSEEKIREARLVLVFSVRQVLKNGLNLLGIDALDEM